MVLVVLVPPLVLVTVMVSPGIKFVTIELVAAAPLSSVLPVIGTPFLLLPAVRGLLLPQKGVISAVRIGGWPKNSLPACTAEAAASAPLASCVTAAGRAAFKLPAVTAGEGRTGGGGFGGARVDLKGIGRQRRRRRRRQHDVLGGAVRQVEGELDRIAILWIGDAEIDGHRQRRRRRGRRRGGSRLGDGRADRRGRNRIQLQSKR